MYTQKGKSEVHSTDLVISGMRPPSSIGCGRPLSTNSMVVINQSKLDRHYNRDNESSANEMDEETFNWKQGYDVDSDDDVISAKHETQNNAKQGDRSNSKNYKKNSLLNENERTFSATRMGKRSTIDDTIFRANRQDTISWNAPWNKNDTPTYVFDATDYKAVAERNAQKKAAKSVTVKAKPLKMRAPSFKPTYIDETLFGSKPPAEPNFPAPWDDGKTASPLLFDGFEHKAVLYQNVDPVKPKVMSSIIRPVQKAKQMSGWKFAFHK